MIMNFLTGLMVTIVVAGMLIWICTSLIPTWRECKKKGYIK